MAKRMPPRNGWHLINVDNANNPVLLHGDARNAKLGEPLSVEYPHLIDIGVWGLHYGNTLLDAFFKRNEVWKGFKICKVQVSGFRVTDSFDHFGCAETRTILEMKDGYPIFQRFAAHVAALRPLNWSCFDIAAKCAPSQSYYMLRNIHDGLNFQLTRDNATFNRLLTTFYKEDA